MNEIKVTDLLTMMKNHKVDEVVKMLGTKRRTLTEVLNKAGCKYNRAKNEWEYTGKGDALDNAVIKFGRPPKPRTVETAAPVESTKKEPTFEPTNQLPRRRAPLTVRKRKSFDIDIELLEQLEHYCYMNRIKQYEFVEQAIRTALQQRQEEH